MNRARRAEVLDITRNRLALIVERTFDGDREPFFDDLEEQALAEQETARIAQRIWSTSRTPGA